MWIWLLDSLIVVLIGVLWTLREEEEEAANQQVRPAATPEPVRPVPPAGNPPPPVVEPPAAEPAPVEAPPPEPDDLKQVTGIGPKISRVLNEYGIYTFEQLANTEVAFLRNLMEEREWQIADPVTWPDQARRLAEAKRSQ